jgi:hypothetical protein
MIKYKAQIIGIVIGLILLLSVLWVGAWVNSFIVAPWIFYPFRITEIILIIIGIGLVTISFLVIWDGDW